DEPRGFVRSERLFEGLNNGQRVLALESAVKIECEEVNEFVVANAQTAPSNGSSAGRLRFEDERHSHDRYRRDRRQRRSDEGGRRPDLVVVRKSVVPVGREIQRLPEPDADVVPVAEEAVSEMRADGEVRCDFAADKVDEGSLTRRRCAAAAL